MNFIMLLFNSFDPKSVYFGSSPSIFNAQFLMIQFLKKDELKMRAAIKITSLQDLQAKFFRKFFCAIIFSA